MKTIANITVKIEPFKAPFLFPCIIQWWAYVMVTPDDNNIMVFNRGSSKGFIDCIPLGGHCEPNSATGAKALWKNAQKTARKNRASDIINKETPIVNPFCTAKVWSPKYVASAIISLNQKDIDKTTQINERYRFVLLAEKLCIFITPILANEYKDIQVNMGQGEGETKWKGWDWNLLLVILVNLSNFWLFVKYFV